jgi:UDPglucose--hexose-1-phosphate uridylyltransferase
MRRYFRRNGRDLLGDYLSRERAEGQRIVCANDHWAVVVPFWAAWPFETLVIPARGAGHLSALFPDERDALADIIGRLNRRYDNLFGVSFPYSDVVARPASDKASHPYWRLHASYFPPLLRSASCGSSWSATSWRRKPSATSRRRTPRPGSAPCRTCRSRGGYPPRAGGTRSEL